MASHAVEVVGNWTDRCLSVSMAAKEQAAKAMVALALDRLSEDGSPPKLRIQWKPVRGVFSEMKVAVGKLVLIPETTKLSVATVATGGGLCAATPIDLGGKQVVLMPIVNLETVVPAWMVRVVDDPDVATMHLTERTVSISLTSQKKTSDPSKSLFRSSSIGWPSRVATSSPCIGRRSPTVWANDKPPPCSRRPSRCRSTSEKSRWPAGVVLPSRPEYTLDAHSMLASIQAQA